MKKPEISQRAARRLLKWAAETSVYMSTYRIGEGVRREDPKTGEPFKGPTIVDGLSEAILAIRRNDEKAKRKEAS